MKQVTILALVAAAFAALALSAPASAQAGIKQLAKQECRADRAEDPGEFASRWGGSGGKAIKRCARDERREARRDCREDRREEPREFATEYGGVGGKAIKRCMRDELR
ncbi:MAG: hypothetical protein GEU88_10820 [Solirubrobacterales bacterium]|nr:hypothetical protein [Solirubrobacterales bacterium]